MKNFEIAEQVLKNDFANIKYPEMGMVQSPEQVLQSGYGHCWEQTELARCIFNQQNIPNKTYFIDYVHNEQGNTKTHTFLVFKDGEHFCWFEHSWDGHEGVRCYNSLNELLCDIIKKLKVAAQSDGDQKCENFRIREYDAPKLPAPHMEVFHHFLKGREITIESLKN
jgi:hypothetical protein